MDDSSPTLVSLRLGGVPEQVNTPISICLERGIFKKHGIDVTFRLVPEGTGAMLSLLEAGEIDIALTVTDAFMVAKSNGRKVKLQGTFVESPLVWAVAAKTGREEVVTVSDLFAKEHVKFGVSRLGSGSHTMAQYLCSVHGKSTDSSSFVIANNFDGLKKGIQDGSFDAFLWETFTTKPSFDNNEVKKIGDVPTPWSAFSFVSGLDPTVETTAGFSKLFAALGEGCEIFLSEAVAQEGDDSTVKSVNRICVEFGHKEEDAALWLSRCRYSTDASYPPMSVDRSATENSIRILKEIKLVPSEYVVTDLWGPNSAIQLKN